MKMTTAITTAALAIASLAGCQDHSTPRPEPLPVDWFTVNAAQYNYGDLTTIHAITYPTVARWRGWTEEEIEAWRPFIVDDIIAKESGGCYNIRGGVRLANGGIGCAVARQGSGQDAGLGQVVLRFNPWLCEQEGYCSPDDITLTAWDSMNALLALIERSGVSPWNYNDFARSYHPTLRNAPSQRPNQD